ncbi:MAG: hypothetical protein ABIA76_01585, partial [Candidatus Diapherotrites archaeon]
MIIMKGFFAFAFFLFFFIFISGVNAEISLDSEYHYLLDDSVLTQLRQGIQGSETYTAYNTLIVSAESLSWELINHLKEISKQDIQFFIIYVDEDKGFSKAYFVQKEKDCGAEESNLIKAVKEKISAFNEKMKTVPGSYKKNEITDFFQQILQVIYGNELAKTCGFAIAVNACDEEEPIFNAREQTIKKAQEINPLIQPE